MDNNPYWHTFKYIFAGSSAIALATGAYKIVRKGLGFANKIADTSDNKLKKEASHDEV